LDKSKIDFFIFIYINKEIMTTELLYICITKNDQLISLTPFFTTGVKLYQIISSNFFKLKCHMGIDPITGEDKLFVDYSTADDYKLYITFQSSKYKHITAKPHLTPEFINERAILIDFNSPLFEIYNTKALIYNNEKFKMIFTICDYANIGQSGLVIDCPMVEFH
jgi:hypothetical protein